MAASHEMLVALDLPHDELGALVERAGRRLEAEADWSMYGSAQEFSVRFTVASGWVPRERVWLQIERRRVRIISRCCSPLRFIDFGKNRRNVAQALKALLECASGRLAESLRIASLR